MAGSLVKRMDWFKRDEENKRGKKRRKDELGTEVIK